MAEWFLKREGWTGPRKGCKTRAGRRLLTLEEWVWGCRRVDVQQLQCWALLDRHRC